MTARVLVVDDVRANVKLLEAKLTAEYFDPIIAMNGLQALDLVDRLLPDIVLLDVMMPGMDGIEVCRRLKSSPRTQHIPVIMITALDQPEDRVRGLEAGADDFLTKPVDDTALFSRVKNLVRLKMLVDELRARAATGERMGFIDNTLGAILEKPGEVMLVDDTGHLAERIAGGLSGRHHLLVVDNVSKALSHATEGHFDLIMVGLDQRSFDGLRLCSQLRSLNQTRHIPILVIAEPEDNERLLRALDMGVNDYLLRPVDPNELMARMNTQIRRWRYAESLRDSVQRSIEMAITDELTGIFNRRYMETHLATLIESAMHRARPTTVLAIDIDFFKSVNDTFGHDAGDQVLRECAARLRNVIRSVDLPCRVGGEEFIVILPDTDQLVGARIAERIRSAIGSAPFIVGSEQTPVTITVSIGVAGLGSVDDTAELLLKRADQSLYQAKRAGRDRVVSDMPDVRRPG
ncbi:two-component system cell cycle response regulator [Rhodoligotrophos appendicifer]|uniref:PleD family two-component system response regulator n=1 Tax=Rhodoligotrophos appendicifer TaxID=987056 RepID=UPI001186527D|nr:PleD family two-component system response regulator [Rhodoligotrophos appendicifer]